MPEPADTLQIVSEQATVKKRDVITGRVRVSTRTESRGEPVSATLKSEDVSVERVPINREVDAAPAIRTEGDVTIVPVVEEVLVVEKRLLLREELHIRKTVSEETVETEVALRKQHAVVDRVEGIQPSEEDI